MRRLGIVPCVQSLQAFGLLVIGVLVIHLSLEHGLEAFDDAALLADDHFLAFDIVFENLVIFCQGGDLMCQSFIVFLETLEQRIHLLHLRGAWLPNATFLELAVFLGQCVHTFFE